jgi:hypothetical protein
MTDPLSILVKTERGIDLIERCGGNRLYKERVISGVSVPRDSILTILRSPICCVKI